MFIFWFISPAAFATNGPKAPQKITGTSTGSSERAKQNATRGTTGQLGIDDLLRMDCGNYISITPHSGSATLNPQTSMNKQTVYCEECLEDIPNGEMFWDEKRLYCGRCGSELDPGSESQDIFEEITTQKAQRLLKLEDEEYDEEDEEEDDYYDEDEDAENEEDEYDDEPLPEEE